MEITDKLARLNQSTVTTAPALLNEIFLSMNSKVRNIPDYETKIFQGVEIAEWQEDMNQKMNKMQRETARTIFSKYIIKPKADSET